MEWVIDRQRIIVPEKLDYAPPGEARENLRDLVRVNKVFGGHRILRKMIGQFAGPQDSFSMLDVGAASGDMGVAVRRSYPRATVTSFDYRQLHLALAPYPKVIGDAFRLPFALGSFDFVFCSLFLHHFSDDQVLELLRGFRALARRAILAIDLERGPIAYHFMPATRWVFGWHNLSMHDGPASVQAAFKKEELLALAQNAGLANARAFRHWPWARVSLIAPV